MTIITMLASFLSLALLLTSLLLLRRLNSSLSEQNTSPKTVSSSPFPPVLPDSVLESLEKLLQAQMVLFEPQYEVVQSESTITEILKASSPSYLTEYEIEKAAIEAGEVTPYYG